MISSLRRSLDHWVVRGLFLLMVVSFVIWGVGDVLRQVFFNSPTWVAKVDGQTIEGQQFQTEFQRAMAQASRRLPQGQEPTAKMRSQVGEIVLQRMITEAALRHHLARLRIVTPDAAVRAVVFAMPEFHDSSGKFSRQVMASLLANNGLTQDQFLQDVRQQLSKQQLLQAIAVGARPSKTETDTLFEAEFEKRSATMAAFPIESTPPPPPPSEAQLKRWYANHPWDYRAPEYRKIQVVILSPETLASQIKITDAELHAAYEQNKAAYVTPAKRTAEVLTVPDEAKAKALATQWSGSVDWKQMQAAASKAGGSAVELNDATERMFPDPALGKAVFAASPDTVAGPVKGALAWYVIKVTQATAGGSKSFDDVKPQLRDRILAAKATDLMYDRANKLDDLLGNGTPMDKLPSGLGVKGVSGTLDASGNDLKGNPAPVPGPPALRQAVIQAAFKTRPGDLPQMVEVHTPSTGGTAYYAINVEQIIRAKQKPFDTVKQQVAGDWTDHQHEREAEVRAAKMLSALNGGQSFADAATVAGVKAQTTPLVTRSESAQGMPPELQKVLFGLKKGEPTMVETPDNFVVAQPAQIVDPAPKSDPADYAKLETALQRSMASDIGRHLYRGAAPARQSAGEPEELRQYRAAPASVRVTGKVR